jgi:hypothetical protein
MAIETAAILGLISATTALVASVVGPVVTLTVAKRQFSATVLSGNRQKWIEALRDDLAELISLLATGLVVKSKWKDKWEQGRGALNAEPALLDKFERIVLTQARIQLLINPADEDHQRLSEAIDSAADRLRSEEATDTQTETDIRTIVALAQSILKREWQRVKLGT